MKLVSLYIEQFGGLRQYRLDFTEGLTVVREENGFGKTTLAEFIRAMFYGFPRKTKTLGKRQKYLPWSGGKCAGNLEFEYEGVRYRIERTFGATPKSDTFKLLEAETNRPSTRFSENIGLELFGLDGESFERSTYLPQNHDAGPLSTDSIRAKLGDLVEDTGDVGNFENAAAALRAKRTGYEYYRGSGGSAAEAQSQITALQMELDRCLWARQERSRVRVEISRLEEEVKKAEGAKAQVRSRFREASEGAQAAAVQKYGRQLEQQLEDARKEADARSAPFAQGIPTREDLETQRSKCTEYLTLTAQAKGMGLSEEEKNELARLRPAFQTGALDEACLETLSELHRQLDRVRERQGAQDQEEPAKFSLAAPILAVALGVAALVAGIILLAGGQYLPGGIGAGLGVLALILGVFLGMKAMIAREVSGTARQKRADLAAEEDALTAKLEMALGVRADFHRAIRERHLDRERYLDLEVKEQRAAAEAAALLTQAAALGREVDAFLECYFPKPILPAEYHRALDALARAAQNYTQARVQATQAAAELESYRREHSRELAMAPVEPLDLVALEKQEWQLEQTLKKLGGELQAMEQRRSHLREQADRVPELEDRIAALQEKKQADREKARLLDDTLDFLQQAKDSLATSYLGPIRTGFNRYLKTLMDTESGRILIDPDLNIQPERLGEARELAYFSAGQTDLLMLCMRFALVDALFAGEKPFVILDDPFVNLDDRRTAAALALLRELSRDRQILYLVCNSSRT